MTHSKLRTIVRDCGDIRRGLPLGAQMIRNSPVMQETQVWCLGWEDPLEKEIATHSSSLTWRIPWTEGPGGLQSIGLQKVRHDWAIAHTYWTLFIFGFFLLQKVWGSNKNSDTELKGLKTRHNQKRRIREWVGRTTHCLLRHTNISYGTYSWAS